MLYIEKSIISNLVHTSRYNLHKIHRVFLRLVILGIILVRACVADVENHTVGVDLKHKILRQGRCRRAGGRENALIKPFLTTPQSAYRLTSADDYIKMLFSIGCF